MQTLRKFKRGDTFSLVAKITDADGKPVTGIAADLRAEIRNGQDVLRAECVIAETTVAGSYSLTVADTTGWLIETLYLDIQRTTGGVVASSETIVIPVEKDITL